jgi:hypothetical protein
MARLVILQSGRMENPTSLSFAGVVKWIVLIMSISPLFRVYQGLVLRETTSGIYPSRYEVGETLRGGAAIQHGFKSLGVAVLMWVAAWAIWFFWQRNED